MTDYKKIFIDTAPIIYFLDDDANYGNKVEKIFANVLTNNSSLVSSTITCEEYLVHPFRQNNTDKVEAFFDFINDCGIPLYDVTVDVAKKAARIRADYQYFKGMDALQLAIACENGCDVFLTNDKQFKQFSDLKCILIDEWV